MCMRYPSGSGDGVAFEGEALPVYEKFGRDLPGYLPNYESEMV